MTQSLTLSHTEIVELTGYRMQSKQLAELRRQGFHRARRLSTGVVLLERAHYEAVCGGCAATVIEKPPQLRPRRPR